MAIDDLEKRLTAIEEQLKPRPRSVNAIVAITVTVVLAGAAAIWGLANVIRDRPTATQIQEILRSSDGSHDRSIQNEQAAEGSCYEKASGAQYHGGLRYSSDLLGREFRSQPL